METPCKHCNQYALIFFFLVLAHLQALDCAHTHGLNYDRGTLRDLSLPLHRSSWKKPAAHVDLFQPGGSGAAAVSKKTKTFSLPHQIKTSRTTGRGFRRLLTTFAATSNREVEALTSFRAGISAGDIDTFRSWDANDSTPCTWKGVSCSLDKQHVTALSLPSHQLVGSIDSALLALGKLQFLQRLDLSDNKFSSAISGATLANFSSLAYLNLSYNQVTGEIPHQVGDLAKLQTLSFIANNLSGQIPPSIGNCSSLRVLNLQSNFLHGQIPQAIGRLSHLQLLDLSSDEFLVEEGNHLRNHLSGLIPPALGNCSSLSSLILDYNTELGGQIPRELNQLRNLEVLSLYACKFQDVLPRWISNQTNIVKIDFSRNQFHGPLSVDFGKLPNLSYLGFGDNNLTGKISPDIGNITSLTWLVAADNLLTGVVPSSLRNCVQLQDLVLGGNPLMDPEPLPSWIASLTQLTQIYMPDMNLYGEIPDDICKPPNLSWLDLWGNSLTGSIPSSLSNCTALENLALNRNHLTGRIPPDVGLLEYLSFFSVYGNSLTGSIPVSMTNLTQLSSMDVGRNFLSGTIGGDWGQLQQLAEFGVTQNFLVGSIPETLSNCSNLYQLFLDTNDLTGEIPASLGNLSQLWWLTFSTNRISGAIPGDLARCSALSNFDASLNQLEGTFPPEFGSLSFLSFLYLHHNQLSGVLADSLTNLTQMVYLELSHNNFIGNVPGESISQMQLLTFMNVSHNSLSGSLSADWSHINAIQTIDLSSNNISGSISYLGNLKSLQWLDVSRNNFSGDIPGSLASLDDLTFFDASYNDFTGPVPTFAPFQSNITAASFLGNPGLCGAMVGRECRDNATNSGDKCKHLHCAGKWIAVSVAGAVGILLAVLLVVWLMIRRATRKAAKEREFFSIVGNVGPNLFKFAPADVLAVVRDKNNVIGSSGKSVVYKGSIPGYDEIAIKTLVGHYDEDMDSRAPELWQNLLDQEAKNQAKLRHRNVLRLLGFCYRSEFRALLFEYMPQGSLDDHLYPGSHSGKLTQDEGGGDLQKNCKLPWGVRFGIAADVAEGMTYLHHDCPEPLIHGDLKPSNVLLDNSMLAKVADFGISKLVNPQREEPGEATAQSICGTFGYMPPEYAYVTTVSTQGDVFSYGMLLLEMLSGMPPTDADVASEEDYRDWQVRRFQESPFEVLDPVLQREAGREGTTNALKYKQMMLLTKVAFFCTRENPKSRPSMKDVLSMLTQIKNLGVEGAERRTVDELAQETAELPVSYVWENEGLNDEALPSVSH